MFRFSLKKGEHIPRILPGVPGDIKQSHEQEGTTGGSQAELGIEERTGHLGSAQGRNVARHDREK